jgi:hypothetical protein
VDIAAFFVVALVAVEEAEDDLPVLVVPLGVVPVPVVVGVVADVADVVGVVPVPVVVAAVVPAGVDKEEAVPFKQLVELPVSTVNGADCEISPLLSRRVMSRLVPTAKLTAAQVNEVPF